jgi:parallel beta-helix repeat protein
MGNRTAGESAIMKSSWLREALGRRLRLVLSLVLLLGIVTPVSGATILVVSSTSDSGSGTLRQAMLNASAGDVITFSSSVFPPTNPATIFIKSALPTLTRNNVSIDASNAGVIIDGSQAPPGTRGFVVAADLCVIRGLTVQRFTWDGIWIETGADGNTIGGDRYVGIGPNGQGNRIVMNEASGISILGGANVVRGNYVGIDTLGVQDQGNAMNGIALWSGATANIIGDTASGYRNVISGNDHSGIWVSGDNTSRNELVGNYIGTNAAGDAALGNMRDGISLDGATHDNRVERNVLSGNGSNGIVIGGGAYNNVVYGNLIGTDKTGTVATGGQPGGGLDLANGAHHNTVGGLDEAKRNVISGNGIDGVFLEGPATQHNVVQGNYIGTDVSGTAPIPNSWGMWILNGAPNNTISGNLIRYNTSHGVEVSYSAQGSEIASNTISQNGEAGIHFASGGTTSLYKVISNTITSNGQAGVLVEKEGCPRITITSNSVSDNNGKGIDIRNDCVAAPEIIEVAIGSTEIVTGTAPPNTRVELFSDNNNEGQVYEGYTTADGMGRFVFGKVGGFAGPNITATSTDVNGDTSEFSQVTHLSWTFLLYLNGDNDLGEIMLDTLYNIVAAGPSPRANVLVLVDGYTTTMAYSGTILYDVTDGQATPITATLGATLTVPGELNMGDGQTLAEFVHWGRLYYPSRYTMLAIVDHGGGWAPGAVGGGLAHRNRWFSGGSGLSWDFSSDYDYLDSGEIRQAMANATDGGADPLDVVFFDVCLMGMIEVAYQVKDYASFYISSQNIGWAPSGPQGRYVRVIQKLEATAGPRRLAEFLVETYADSMPPYDHPYTISAVDLASLPEVATATDDLAAAISETLASPNQVALLQTVYSETQKLDYDSDFRIESASDGFVDLYDFALRAAQRFTDTDVIAAAQAVTAALDTTIVAEEHRSGSPWVAEDQVWDLDDVHGLSIFLPLGEDLQLPSRIISGTSPITVNVALRDTYTGTQLLFVADTGWRALIDTYYNVVSSPVPTGTTEGPVDGPQVPDLTPPQTAITVTGTFRVGEAVTITWTATDDQTGVAGAMLWHQQPPDQPTAVLIQIGSSGVFTDTLVLSQGCVNSFAVRAFDRGGLIEPWDNGSNIISVRMEPCVCLPLVLKDSP